MPIDDDDPEDIENDPEIEAFFAGLPEGEGNLDMGQLPPRIADKLFGAEMAGVQCPKCRWVPRTRMAWGCKCGHLWNTFGTRGLCPACSYQWNDTQCSNCHEWSPHDDWHVPVGLPS